MATPMARSRQHTHIVDVHALRPNSRQHPPRSSHPRAFSKALRQLQLQRAVWRAAWQYVFALVAGSRAAAEALLLGRRRCCAVRALCT